MNPALALALAILAFAAHSAQLYKWVDEQGRVEWRDTPPPPNAKNVEQRTMSGNTVQTSTLPYSLQVAMKSHPVTLWAFDCGEPCTSARNHLAKRGVPYSERNATRESEALKKLTGSLEVPVLIVGSRTIKGYLDSEWDAALDTAGYPRTPAPGVKAQLEAARTSQPQAPAGKDASKTPAQKAETPKPTARQP